MAKTSDLDGGKEHGVPKRPKSLRPSQLAELQGCSERTIREWCKKGLIPEAYQTPGGQWRIRMPLSWKTRGWLHRHASDWPFKKNAGDFEGDSEPDFAEWLLLAQLYECDLREWVPVPYLAEQGEEIAQDLTEQAEPEKASKARRIQDEIIRRLKSGESLSDLLLLGWVYQFWRKNQRRPTVAEIGELMGLNRAALYRRGYSAQKIDEAYLTAAGELKRILPDPSGLDSVQIANLKAKK